MNNKKVNPLWDIPTRVFHLALIIILPLAWWSAEEGNFNLHQWLGYTLIVLLVSRIIWGFVGSRHSRFSNFLTGPGKIIAYLKGAKPASPGHNPLGAWSVVALLSLLLLQAFSGLFNTDDVLFNGPLYYAASDEFRDAMGVVHEWTFNILLALIALHISAVLYYQLLQKQRLIQAMIKGYAQGKEGLEKTVPAWRALVIVAIVAAALWFGLEQAPQPKLMW